MWLVCSQRASSSYGRHSIGELVVGVDPAIRDSETVAGNSGAVVCALEGRLPSLLAVEFVCDFQLGEGRYLPVTGKIVDTGKKLSTLRNRLDWVSIYTQCCTSYYHYRDQEGQEVQ